MEIQMTINVEDYLSRDEIVDEIRYQIRRKVDKDAERILSNTAYDVVFEAVNKALDGKMQETIKNKVLVIINELNDFNVFRSADAWGSPQTVGMKVLNEAIEENRPAIKERVRELVNRYDINSRIEQRIDDSLEDIILTVLKDGLNHNR